MQTILTDFDIPTNQQILARREDLVIVEKKKETEKCGRFCLGGLGSVKLKEIKKRDKCLDLVIELKINSGT